MNRLTDILAAFQIGQAETYYERHSNEINVENVQPEPPAWKVCAMPSKWTPSNWKWFLLASGTITIQLQ